MLSCEISGITKKLTHFNLPDGAFKKLRNVLNFLRLAAHDKYRVHIKFW